MTPNVPECLQPLNNKLYACACKVIEEQLALAFLRSDLMGLSSPVVARDVEPDVYQYLCTIIDTPIYKFEYDARLKIIRYLGDPSDVHEYLTKSIEEEVMEALVHSFESAPVFSEALERLVQSKISARRHFRNDGERAAKRGRALAAAVVQSTGSSTQNIRSEEHDFMRSKQADILYKSAQLNGKPPQFLLSGEVAVWNETVEDLASEVERWCQAGAHVSIGIKVDRRHNSFDPLLYCLVAFEQSTEANGEVETSIVKRQFHFGRGSAVRCDREQIEMSCITGLHDLYKEAIDYDCIGVNPASHQVVPDFENQIASDEVVIPMGIPLIHAISAAAPGLEGDEAREHVHPAILRLDLKLFRTEIISMCFAEDGAHQANFENDSAQAAYFYARFAAGVQPGTIHHEWRLEHVRRKAAIDLLAAERLAVQAAKEEALAAERRRREEVRGRSPRYPAAGSGMATRTRSRDA